MDEPMEIDVYIVAGTDAVYDEDDLTRPVIEPGLAVAYGWRILLLNPDTSRTPVFDTGPIYFAEDVARGEIERAREVDPELALIPVSPDLVSRA